MVRTVVAATVGVLAGLGAGLGTVLLRPHAAAYLAAVVAVGVAVTLVLTQSGVGATPRAVTAVLVTACLLAVAAPRPGATGPRTDEGPFRFETTDGTTLAYHLLGVDREATPAVYLHGGPGVSTRQQDLSWLEALARNRPVLAYDQIGTGGSSRLDDPTGYSLERAREDLEALRRHVGLDRVVLVGHSWGAVVAASYVAVHPGRVEAVIALAPGSLDPEADLADDPSVRLEGQDRIRLLTTLLRPRELYTYALSRVDPIAAHHLLGDAEMDRRYEDVLQAVWPAMLCIPDRASGLPPPSGGFFANQLTHQRRTPSGPVSVVADPPPTLVLKPECDYLPWSVVDGFVERLDAQVAYVRGAGHAVHVERGEHVADSIADFLTGGTPPGVLIDPTSAPPSYQGPP